MTEILCCIMKNKLTSKCLKPFFVLQLCLFFFDLSGQRLIFTQIPLPEEIHSINTLLCDDDSTVWLATSEGLYKYDGIEFKRYFEVENSELYKINVLVKDGSNNMWFGTYLGQLVKYSEGRIQQTFDIKPLRGNDNCLITSLTLDHESNNPEILLTTSGGEIFAIDTTTKAIKKIKSPVEGTIYSIHYGYAPTVWLCTSDGFFTMQKNSKWKKKTDMSTAYGLYENEGKFWAIGRDELNKALLMLYYDEAPNGSQKRYVWKDFELSKLADRYTRFYSLAFTKNEMVWIASQNGLIKYNPLNASVKQYSKEKRLNINEIRHITVQNENLIWVSSSGKRFIRVDIK